MQKGPSLWVQKLYFVVKQIMHTYNCGQTGQDLGKRLVKPDKKLGKLGKYMVTVNKGFFHAGQ